jgi:hypothetical protein
VSTVDVLTMHSVSPEIYALLVMLRGQ